MSDEPGFYTPRDDEDASDPIVDHPMAAPEEPHHLDTGPEHLRSTPNVHEQEDGVEAPRPINLSPRQMLIAHLTACALDPRALPAVELSCEVRRQLLGKAGGEGLPGWALQLYLLGAPAARHALPSEYGEALQEVAAVFAEAMQQAVDRVREEAAQAARTEFEGLVAQLGRRATIPFRIMLRVITLGGEVGEVVSGRGYADGSEGALVRFPNAKEGGIVSLAYTPAGLPESLDRNPSLFRDLFPYVIAYVKES